MNIDSIQNGVVIDHIRAGQGMKLYNLLKLDETELSVAIIRNVNSGKMGKKDIIKIDADIPLNLDIVAYVDPGATVNIIRSGKLVEKRQMELPETLTDVLVCKNPRCISSTEQELHHIFKLTDRENKVYRCLYCETKAGG
ncbi:MAG: aspartate carbamoyltransferase regulatory subunit [Oscillospiraceae bacterium]|nr:aspartate carbamoyltransferase regulatory subunit [Oscillospiraceae bacterium]